MGNIQNLASRICKKSPPQQSIFSQQQQLSYSKTTGKKCLQRIIDIDNIGHSNSLKKIYRYLHPALKYILYCKQESLVSIEHMEDKDKNKMHNKGENIDKDNQIIDVSLQENFILIHQQELILSAGTVLQMYCEYLNHVVPANISYFHFMRQKDLYIHYCTLKYVLQAGHSGTMFKTSSKSPSIFLRLKAEPRRSYIKLISHWLYDMIKYKCSAIYLASPTLPHLISIHTSILCGLMCYDVNTNFLANLKTEAQKIQTYQHCLFSFLYVLTEAHIQKIGHSQQGNGCLQLAVIGITKILELMWTDISPQHAAKIKSKIMYAPSYWYASHVGFIHQPTLQTIAYHILTDMLLKIDQPIPEFQSKMLFDSKQSGNSEVQADQDYLSFLEQQSQKEKGEKVEHMGHHGTPKSEVNQLMASNINQQHKNSEQIMSGQISQGIRKYERINLVSQGLMFGCLGLIIRHFSDNLQLQPLHALLLKQSKVTLATSLIRPYILSLTKQLQQQPKSPGIWPQLIKYCEQNRMDYSTRSNIIPYTQVENRFQIFVHKMLGRVLLSYGKQVDKTEGQIWGALGRIGTR